MFVHTLVFRMRALQEGDKYIIKRLVEDARGKVFRTMVAFSIIYALLLSVTAWLVFELQSNPFFDSLDIVVVVVEVFKFVLDQIVLFLFYGQMRRQRDQFEELMGKEERLTLNFVDKNEQVLKKLTRLTTVKLYVLTAIYEFKLLLRVASSLVYTHGLLHDFLTSEKDKLIYNWVFCSLTLTSVLLTLVGGLIFLRFTYVLNIARVKRSLFESGIIVDEESSGMVSAYSQLNVLREGYSSVEPLQPSNPHMSSQINEDDNVHNGLEDAEVVNMEEYEECGS
jgi:hypothetical protein